METTETEAMQRVWKQRGGTKATPRVRRQREDTEQTGNSKGAEATRWDGGKIKSGRKHEGIAASCPTAGEYCSTWVQDGDVERGAKMVAQDTGSGKSCSTVVRQGITRWS